MSPEQVERASRRIWAAHVAGHLSAVEVETLYRILGVHGAGVWLHDRAPRGARMRQRGWP